MRSDYYFKQEIDHILAALMPPNRLALEISLATGLRINDVLSLKTADVQNGRFSVQEQKTGKRKSITLPKALQARCVALSGSTYCFPNRLDGMRHRTRQAVWKDLKRVSDIMRIPVNLTPHSMRKVYAVDAFHKSGNIKKVQKLLNHSSEAVTLLYALADAQMVRTYGR